jgi:uncharacterized protein YcfL
MKLALVALLLAGCASHRVIYVAQDAVECAMQGKLLGAIAVDDESNTITAKLCASVKLVPAERND